MIKWIRPPGAVDYNEFIKTCIRCRKCGEICPYYSILFAHGDDGLDMGTPYIIPRTTPCYLCMKCPDICPTGALTPDIAKEEVKMGIAVLDQSLCLAYNGILCRSCYERCPIYREAISLSNEIYPVVHEEKCVGCGICENVCPTETAAIIIIPAE